MDDGCSNLRRRRSGEVGALLQPGDTNGVVDMVDGFFDLTTERVWIVLANVDTTTSPLACKPTKATVIAIDSTTNTLLNLGGSGPGGGYPFTLYDPAAVIFDSVNKRLLATAYGCEDVDAGGAVLGAGVEAISLVDGTSSVLFAARAFDYVLDLTARTVKLALAVTPSPFVSDGAGFLYGTAPASDGGAALDLVKVDVSSGLVQTLARGVVADPTTTSVGGVALYTVYAR